MGINSFLKPQSGGKKQAAPTTRSQKFNQEVQNCSSKREERDLEQSLLEPEKIRPYTGKAPTAAGPRENAVTIFLPNNSAVELLGKHFRVSTYVEKSISDPSLLLDFLELLENGEIGYDKKTRKFNFNPSEQSGRSDSEGSAPVDTRKQRSCNRPKGRR